MDRDKLLSSNEVREYLGLPKRTFYRLVEEGILPGFKVGGRWRFKEEDVEAYLERGRGGKYRGRVFPFWIMTRYYQAPQKYKITKKGQTGWLSLREEYLKKLSEAERQRKYFKPIKYRKIRLWYGETAIMISSRYLARLPKEEQKDWLQCEIKSP